MFIKGEGTSRIHKLLHYNTVETRSNTNVGVQKITDRASYKMYFTYLTRFLCVVNNKFVAWAVASCMRTHPQTWHEPLTVSFTQFEYSSSQIPVAANEAM